MLNFTPIPILFQLGAIKIYSHGLLTALAFLIPFLIARARAKKSGIKLEHLEGILILAVIGGLLGARIGYIILNFSQFSNPLEMLKIWHGGLTSYGGIFGAFLFCFFYIRRKKLSFLEYTDFFSPYIALGFAIGRIGCFFNWDAYGKPTTLFLAVVVSNMPRHATQLYLVAGFLVIFAILLAMQQSMKAEKGRIFFLFLGLYSLLNFAVDFVRSYPVNEYFYGFSVSQWISLVLLFAAIFFILVRKSRIRELPDFKTSKILTFLTLVLSNVGFLIVLKNLNTLWTLV